MDCGVSFLSLSLQIGPFGAGRLDRWAVLVIMDGTHGAARASGIVARLGGMSALAWFRRRAITAEPLPVAAS